MVAPSFLPALLGLLAVAGVHAQRVEINYGNSAAIDLMRRIGAAEKKMDFELAEQLKKQLSHLRSMPDGWPTECNVMATLEAEVFVVNDPSDPLEEIKSAMGFLDEFWRTDEGGDLPYPGDFEQFMHADGFRILRMPYDSLPLAVRQWREDEMEKGTAIERKFIAVLDGVAFFAPGVVTYLMPLFASKDIVKGTNACQDELVELSNFHDPKKRVTEFAKYEMRYNGRIELDNSVNVQLLLQKLVNPDKRMPHKEEL